METTRANTKKGMMVWSSPVTAQEPAQGRLEDFVASLKRLAAPGVRVELSPDLRAAGVQVDVVISSESDRVGVICDQSDARKVYRRNSLLNGLFVERLYLTSSLDALMDPRGIAREIAYNEPMLFSESSRTRGPKARKTRLAIVTRRGSEHDYNGAGGARRLEGTRRMNSSKHRAA